MKRAAALLVLLLGLGLGLAGVATSAASHHHTKSTARRHQKASVVAVAMRGSPTRPVFQVRGTGLRVPRAQPHGSPSGKRLCHLRISGNAGHDYGNRLYVIVYKSRHGRRLYGAGRYYPHERELDCIGLIVLSHSSRRITFTFGSAYTQYAYPLLRNGRRVKIVLGSDAKSIVAHYRG
jgi:hypothetical protein